MDTEQDASMPVETESSQETGPRSGFPLGELPVELLYRVARPLSTTEFCALRLTCRAVEQRLFQTFSREFFSRKQFMMSTPSLQALVDIAHHPHLSAKLQHVTIGLEILGKNVMIPRVQRISRDYGRNYRLGQEAQSDQNTLFSSGRAVEMLTEAFKNLPNLVTVSIRDEPSRSRFRDFNSGLKHWNSYGYPTLDEKVYTGPQVRIPSELRAFSTCVFSAVTEALARSGARPENIEMILRDTAYGVPDYGFYIPRTEAERTRHKAFLSGLRKLHLCIVLQVCWFRFEREPSETERMEGTEMANIRVVCYFDTSYYIAQTAPNLEWLRLNFYEYSLSSPTYTGIAEAFLMDWAYGGPGFKEAGVAQTEQGETEQGETEQKGHERVEYPKLKRLDLGFAEVTARGLCRVLKSLPALEELSLHHMTLLAGLGSEPLMPEWVLDETHITPSTLIWQSFLHWLPLAAPNLKHVEITGPVEASSITKRPVVLDYENYNFAIHVEADENLANECAKAAAQLSYVPDSIGEFDTGEEFANDHGGEHDDNIQDDMLDDQGGGEILQEMILQEMEE